MAVSEKRMSGRRYDQSLDLRELDAFKGFLEQGCNAYVRPWYL